MSHDQSHHNPDTVLLVEDEEIVAALIQLRLEEDGVRVIHVSSAEAAWEVLQGGRESIASVLLDRQLPGMSGMDLLHQIKQSPALRDIPVIMETGEDDAASIREGLAAGAYYYLTKPLDPRLLHAIVVAALAQFREASTSRLRLQGEVSVYRYLREASFSCRTLTEARELSLVLAAACPEPERAVLGLQELLVNAVEHGNLGIRYAEKTQLLLDDAWDAEIERRLIDPRWCERRVSVDLAQQGCLLEITIRDEGEGFDWQNYLDFDPERAYDPHGRGIAMARSLSFDSLEYQGNGNTVLLRVNRPA